MSLDKLSQWLQDTLQPGSSKEEIKHYKAKDFQSGKGAHYKPQKNKQSRHMKKAAPIHEKGVPKSHRLKIIPLGGLNEIGKNMMILEYGNDIIVIDMGFEFPSDDLLGIDYVIPDISYLEERLHKIRGVIITHGHLDHTGGIPYMLPRLKFPPIYGTKLTMGLVEKRLDEFKQLKVARINSIDPDRTLKLGKFTVDFFRVNHSIPGCVGVVVSTPAGTIVHTGDFKFDYTPADNIPADFQKIAMLGNRKITALFSDSTNASKPGHTLSERKIGENLDKLIRETQGRIIIASFSSLIGRIQQIIESAQRYRRKIYVSGRSMIDNIAIAQKLGYIKAPPHAIHDIRRTKAPPGKDSIILTTGSQGEAVSALARMAMGSHANIRVRPGDTVVISASPVPGNEISMYTMVNNLCRLGANVIHHKIMDIHTSGHGCQEDLKLMMSLVKPKYLVPVHGEYYMRQAHAKLGQTMGLKSENTVLVENGNIIEIYNDRVHVSKEKVETNYILVDGEGVGDIASEVIHERQAMSRNGVAIITLRINKQTRRLIGEAEIVTKGFIYQTETKAITKELQQRSREAYGSLMEKDPKAKQSDIKRYITSRLDRYIHKKLARQPLIVPIIVEA